MANVSLRASLLWSAVRNFAIRFGSVIVFFVLARILTPDELGMFAAALAVLAFLELFAENGIGDAIVQKQEVTEGTLSAGLFINVLFGALVTVFVAIFAEQIAHWLNADSISDILMVSAIGVLLNSASFVPQAYYRRKFEFKWLAARAMAGSLISGVVGIGLALGGAGPWSMVGQFLVLAVVNTVMVWWRVPFVPSKDFCKTDVKALSHFGFAILGGRVLYYLSIRSIELVITASFGTAALALYIMGSRINNVAQQLLSAVTIDVFLPKFSRLVGDRSALNNSFYQAMEVTAAIALPLFICLAALAPEVIQLAFGQNGRGAELMLGPLALFGAMQALLHYNGTILNALGRPYISLGLLSFRCVAIFAVFWWLSDTDATTMIHYFVVASFVMAPVSFAVTRMVVGFSIMHLLNRCLPFVFSAVVMYAAVYWLRSWLPAEMNVMIRLIVLGLGGAVSYLATLLLFFRPRIVGVINLVLRRAV